MVSFASFSFILLFTEVDSNDDQFGGEGGIPDDFKTKLDKLEQIGSSDVIKNVKKRQKAADKSEPPLSSIIEHKSNYVGLSRA